VDRDARSHDRNLIVFRTPEYRAATDANLDEALRRGADELWIVWTVSVLGRWRHGFVNEYFQVIEASANSSLRDPLRRIEQNNAAFARGLPCEWGRHVEGKLLQAEGPRQGQPRPEGLR